MTTLLCLNPNARNGDTDTSEIVDRLGKIGRVLVHHLDDETPLMEVAESHRDDLERIVVGGGDGTLNAALPVVKKLGLPMGVIPLGTANDFARSLCLPSNPSNALTVILAGKTRPIDIANANGHLFLNAAGMGLGPELTKRMDEERKKKLGVLAYAVSLFEVLDLKWRKGAVLKLNGRRKLARFMQITIVNGVHYGGGLKIADDASFDDGLLHVLTLRPQSGFSLLSKILPLKWGISRGNEREPGMRLYRASRIEVKTKQPTDVTLDGEFLTQTPLKCSVERGAIECYCEPEKF